MTARVVACLAACAALAAVAVVAGQAKTRPQTGNGIEGPGTAGWPAVAAQLAKNIARDSFAHDYDRVWTYLHPTYRRVVSQERWQTCQRAHPVVPRGIKITRVAVAQANELPVELSLLGRQEVQQIQLYVQYTTPGVRDPQAAVLSTFWLKQGKTWTAVWLSDEYRAYKAGRCYVAGGASPLY
jgi:hypothetical protein